MRFGERTIFYVYDSESWLEPELAFELGPDGACLDCDGFFWAAHYGGGKLVQVGPDGRQLHCVHLPRGRKPTNLACCPTKRLLYVTEAEFGLLYQIDL
jgi:sugar lactone lactonase YvrE